MQCGRDAADSLTNGPPAACNAHLGSSIHPNTTDATPYLGHGDGACFCAPTADLAVQTGLSSREHSIAAEFAEKSRRPQHSVHTQTPSRPAKRKLILSTPNSGSGRYHRIPMAHELPHTGLNSEQGRCSLSQPRTAVPKDPSDNDTVKGTRVFTTSGVPRRHGLSAAALLQNSEDSQTDGSGFAKRRRRPMASSMLSPLRQVNSPAWGPSPKHMSPCRSEHLTCTVV